MPPKISLVVPMYNVATYVETCLESLALQTVTDLEVIMVDDGSTDETLALAAPFAERDPRFRLVTQPNGGLGKARNTGTDVATGEYLAFVDSDDVVPRHAYESLLAALETSGSDFASGNARRLASYGTSQAAFLSGIFTKTRLGTHITKFPALLADRTAWNKLFRRSFWDEHGLRFPEGMLYEDMPVTVPAHFLARAVDVVDKTVYLWRVREGADLSITQQRTDLRALRDRVRAVDSVSRFLAEHQFDEAKRSYDTNVLREDLRYFLDVLPSAEDDFRAAFLDLANDYLDRADPEVAAPLPAIQRLKWHLVRRRALPQLLEVLDFQETALDQAAPVRRGDEWYGDYPFLDDRSVDVPRSVYRLDDELEPVVTLDELRWADDGSLVVAGSAYIAGLGAPSRRSQTVHLRVESADTVVGSVEAQPEQRPDVTAAASQAAASLDWSGFRAEVPASLLPPTDSVPASVRVSVEIRHDDVLRTATRPAWAAAHPPHAPTRTQGRRTVRARLAAGGELEVATVQDRAVVQAVTWMDGVLQVEGQLRSDEPDTARLHVSRRVGTAELDYPVFVDRAGDRPTFLARVPIGDLLGETDVSDVAGHTEASADGVAWDFWLAGKSRRRVAMPADVTEETWTVDGRELSIERSRFGYLSLVVHSPRPVIAAARWTNDGQLSLAGTFAADGDFALVLRRRRGSEEHLWPLSHGDGRFEVTGHVVGITNGLEPWSLAPGRWDVGVRRADGLVVDAVLDHRLLDELPVATTIGSQTLRFGASGYDTPVIVVERDLAIDEAGGYHQHRLATTRRRPWRLNDAVLYLCHGGVERSDSPRAIHEELVRRDSDLEHLWVVRDSRFVVPEPARAVRADSADYHEALARSRYVVTDDYWPAEAVRRRGQTFLQTWHGPWVKRHGAELADCRPARRSHRRFLQQRAENWSTVLSPGPAFTPVLRRTFPFAGDVLETGLPRADLLHRADDTVAASIRNRLGVPADRRVALYAPTYRDHLSQGRSRYRLGQTLDLDVLRESLGDDWVILFRRHRDVVGRIAPAGDLFVRDVSEYAAPADLLLAADVLVTDYSSLLFDQVSLGRPVLFFTPDLDTYRDQVRGFAIPFEDEAPGPLLRTTSDVVEAFRDLDGVRAEHEKRYDAFAATYCALDDGQAAARVVDALFSG